MSWESTEKYSLYAFIYSFSGLLKTSIDAIIFLRWIVWGRMTTTIKRRNCLMVNSKTIVFVLDLVGALALAASGVVVKYYVTAPQA